MLNVLKFDLYKIVKSKNFIICWIFAIIFCLMQPTLIYLSGGDTQSVIDNLSSSRALDLAVIVFACLLWGKDFSSGYVKNLYCIVNKWHYVLSKFICLVLFCIAYVIMEFLIELFFNYVFGIGVIWQETINEKKIWHFFIKTCAYILLGIKVGSFCFLISNCCQKEAVTIIILLVYYAFLGYQIRELIDAFIDLVFPLNEFLINRYSIFGTMVDDSGYVVNSVWNPMSTIFIRKIIPNFIIPLLYVVLFTILNWLLLKKRNV